MTTSQIVKTNSKTLERQIIENCRELPKVEIPQSTIKDNAYNNPIVNISELQKQTLKKLIDGNN